MVTKPGWLKNAVATSAGWVNPVSNEILMCVKGLPDALPFSKGKIVWPVTGDAPVVEVQPAAEVVESAPPEVLEVIETVTEVAPVVEAAPVARRGRPKKVVKEAPAVVKADEAAPESEVPAAPEIGAVIDESKSPTAE